MALVELYGDAPKQQGAKSETAANTKSWMRFFKKTGENDGYQASARCETPPLYRASRHWILYTMRVHAARRRRNRDPVNRQRLLPRQRKVAAAIARLLDPGLIQRRQHGHQRQSPTKEDIRGHEGAPQGCCVVQVFLQRKTQRLSVYGRTTLERKERGRRTSSILSLYCCFSPPSPPWSLFFLARALLN